MTQPAGQRARSNPSPRPPSAGSRRRLQPPQLGAGAAGAARASGPLAPAVVQVLKAKGTPLRVAEILEGLRANGYRYPSADPKKNLSARIYRLKGVKQVAPGQFAAE